MKTNTTFRSRLAPDRQNSPPPSGGSGDVAPTSPAQDDGPAIAITRARLLLVSALIIVGLIGLYFLIPKFGGLKHTWAQLRRGDPLWLAAGGALELLSIAGYATLFRTVFGRGVPRIDWRASVQIPLAGIAAIRLVAAAGAGGVAVTAWALGRAGMSAHVIAC